MSMIIKKQGSKEYAYLSVREGDKVRQKYVGGTDDPKVKKLLAIESDNKAVPERLAYLFWDTNIKNIQIKKHTIYIIGRILELGDLDAVEWMQMVYPGAKIVEVLLTIHNLSDKSRNFWRLYYGVDNA